MDDPISIPSIKSTQPKGYLELQERKDTGAHYTPIELADFLSEKMLATIKEGLSHNQPLKVLDPSVGDGTLINALLRKLRAENERKIEITGFDIDTIALDLASRNLAKYNPKLRNEDFLDYFLQNFLHSNTLFEKSAPPEKYDLLISNPPYIRTQVLGSDKSKTLSTSFNLNGRLDIYQAFLKAIAEIMNPGGIVGLIIPNRFMTTQAGLSARTTIKESFEIIHIWDMGDTKVFDAAILPAVLLLQKKDPHRKKKAIPKMTSIYSTDSKDTPKKKVSNIFTALSESGIIEFDGNTYMVQKGELKTGFSSKDVWRLSNGRTDSWLRRIKQQTYCSFGDIGKIRVGIKTTADKVFIRNNWEDLALDERPELLKPLITHHAANHYKSLPVTRSVLYTHYSIGNKKSVIDIVKHPRSNRYLKKHREVLERRKYVKDAGRNWYEIWVPQNPNLWQYPKIVFRDISKRPYFWLDESGHVVNGDCYWINCKDIPKELIYLVLAVANSQFITLFYDRKFNNKLYAGRRRFITQYVKHFPIPNPENSYSQKIISLVKHSIVSEDDRERLALKDKIDNLIWSAFDLPSEEVSW